MTDTAILGVATVSVVLGPLVLMAATEALAAALGARRGARPAHDLPEPCDGADSPAWRAARAAAAEAYGAPARRGQFTLRETTR